jgi:hypothetical protein
MRISNSLLESIRCGCILFYCNNKKMDTRFWGPGAWRLLHTITFAEVGPQAQRRLFELLPYVLPCKYCRASLTDYYEKEPLPDFENAVAAQKWLYRVHNHVNGKLRGQGLLATRNPSFDDVARTYKGAENGAFPAWDFLYSVAYNHPLRTKGTPMPGADAAIAATDAEMNRWNTLPPVRRFEYWSEFWRVLPQALPEPWKSAWAAAAATPCELKTRRAAVAWVWNIRCRFDTRNKDPYRAVCSRLIDHSSGCGKSKRARTCRKKRR